MYNYLYLQISFWSGLQAFDFVRIFSFLIFLSYETRGRTGVYLSVFGKDGTLIDSLSNLQCMLRFELMPRILFLCSHTRLTLLVTNVVF